MISQRCPFLYTALHHDEPVMVYNICVVDDHTYFVGEHCALVHNGCDGSALEGWQKNLHDKAVSKGGSGRKVKTYQTYTKTNPETGEVYSGRTSGYGNPAENVRRRDANHHMNRKGFGPAVLDKSSTNYNSIRGREQLLIEKMVVQNRLVERQVMLLME